MEYKDQSGLVQFSETNYKLELGFGGGILEHGSQGVVSSFLQIIIGLITPTKGRVFLFGRQTSKLSHIEMLKIRRRMGWIPRNGRLLSNMTIRENLIIGQMYHQNITRRKALMEAHAMADRLGLGDRIKDRPVELSPEELRMAVFARELMKGPELFVLEKPEADFSSCDLDSIMKIILDRTRDHECAFIITAEPDSALLNHVNWTLSLGNPCQASDGALILNNGELL